MNNNQEWPIVLGTSGILVPGRWLRLRAVIWAIFLSACVLGLFVLTQYLGGWLHLPPNSSYYIVLGIPLLALVGYGLLVAAAEGRRPVEVLPHRGTIAEITMGSPHWLPSAERNHGDTLELGPIQGSGEPLAARVFDSFVFNSYLSGMMEELMFRGILLRLLGRAFGLAWGLCFHRCSSASPTSPTATGLPWWG
jgi:membrane protease YdiL (CAAX protease family)